ncbi:MAG: uracil-DNA glycosylase [Deltaproteobacteria bacterium RIFCSPLOWO2_12_FULL_43_16]|nr:MAG: uracil-DNA glycosylase [Deltaproteobacteria bacterium RIFCSPHIGHO2_02_FULL_43_33]OGQ61504.1 MAG: uracil-DNA glycosylase [Deltaproteobacteria bacterium RIFCSPLOWO2_12_FULL_43_16]HBR17969.1 uracil-DNA glycosylase [Deltaproteobacteria bacterium]
MQDIKIFHKKIENYLLYLKEIGIDELPVQSRGLRAQSSEDIQKQSPTLSSPLSTLKSVREELGDCKRCKLHKQRTNIVFGVGSPNTSLVFVGEGPGEDEDLQGEPFVGRAGQLLTKIINAMGLERKDVYICNVVKCRPPGNRNPEADEIAACRPFLEKQLDVIQPKIIVALGTHAAQTLLNTSEKITALRGRFHWYRDGIQLMPTFHPSYLLRNESKKKEVWEDMKVVLKALGLEIPEGKK